MGRTEPTRHSENQGTDGSRGHQDLVLQDRPTRYGWALQGRGSGGLLPPCVRGVPGARPHPVRTSLSCSVLDSCICFSIWDRCSINSVFSYVNAEMSLSTLAGGKRISEHVLRLLSASADVPAAPSVPRPHPCPRLHLVPVPAAPHPQPQWPLNGACG